ncbi:MAG: nucleotidyltransferase domain-containing protein [Candidatus Eremiobacteraeota bacterium]|nr:nucleotidyltransferase domain-containing protein [Candidatus Eremiobacteraeota bacterium]
MAADDRYLGALVCGSVAEGTATDASDFDVCVVVDDEDACENISHPRIGGLKRDLTFSSLRQREEQSTEKRSRASGIRARCGGTNSGNPARQPKPLSPSRRRAISGLRGAGSAEATLWVLDTNVRARRFYESAGWAPDGTTKVDKHEGF